MGAHIPQGKYVCFMPLCVGCVEVGEWSKEGEIPVLCPEVPILVVE